MTELYILTALAACLCIAWTRSSYAACCFIALLTLYLPWAMGEPRPSWVREPDEIVHVVAVQADPDQRFFWIWTRGNPPIAFTHYYDEEAIRELQEGLRLARQDGQAGTAFRLQEDEGRLSFNHIRGHEFVDQEYKAVPRIIRPQGRERGN